MDGPWRFGALVLVWLAAEGLAIGAERCASNRTLERYVANISLELPDVAFAAYTFAGEVGALRCSQLAVGSIASTRPSAVADGSATLVLSGLSIACTGDYAFRQTFFGFPYGSGALAVASAGSSVSVRLRAQGNASSGLPVDVVMVECVANVRVQTLTFSGGLTAAMLDAFSTAIGAVLEERLGPTLCAAGATQLAQLDLPSVFRNLTERATPYMLADDAPLVAPAPAPTAYAWGEVALGRAVASLNDALCDPAADLPGAAAAFATLLGADAAGLVPLGERVALETSLPGVDGASVRLRNVRLGGLGTLARLQLLRPAGVAPADGVRLDPAAAAAVNRSGLVLELAFTRLLVRADVQLRHAGFDVCADGSATAAARSISLSAVARVPLLASALDTLEPEELLASPASALPRALGCLLASIDVSALALVRARVRLDALDVDVAADGPGRLWPMAAAAADDVVDALGERFGAALMRAVGGLLSGPVSEQLAAELARGLGAARDGAVCEPRGGEPAARAPLPDAPAGALDWGQSEAFTIVTETLINEALSDTQLLDPNAFTRALIGGAGAVGLIPDRREPIALSFSVGELATLDVRLPELALLGLDSVQSLQLRAASAERPDADPSAIVLRARLERVTLLAASLRLAARAPPDRTASSASSLLDELFPSNGLVNGTWDVLERAELALAFSGVTLAVTARLPLLGARLRNLTFYEGVSLRGLPCVLASIDASEVRLVEAELDFASFDGTQLEMASSPIWDSVRPMVNLALRGVLGALAPSARSALRAALAAPPLYPLLDEALRRAAQDALGNVTCEPRVAAAAAAPPRSLPGAVSLASFAAMAERALARVENLPAIANALIAGLSGGDGEVATSADFRKTIVASLELPACLGLLNVTLARVAVGGLASLAQLHFAAPEPAQDQSVRIAAAVEALIASADVQVSVEPRPLDADDAACARARGAAGARSLTPPLEAGESRETLQADGVAFSLRIAVDAARPSVDTTVLVAINASAASDSTEGDATLGSILAPPCARAADAADGGGGGASNASEAGAAAASPRRLNVTALHIRGTVSDTHVELLESARDRARATRAVAVVDGAVRAFARAYGAELIDAAGVLLLELEAERGLADRALRTLFASGADASAAACAAADDFTTRDGLIRWEAYRPLSLLDGILRRRLGLRGMNALIRGGLEALSGVPGAVAFGGSLVAVNATLGARFGRVDLDVADAGIGDVDTFSEFALLQPAVAEPRRRLAQRDDADDEAPVLLETSFVVGAVDARALRVSARARAALARDNGTVLELAARLALSLAQTDAAFALDARVSAARLHAVPIRSLLHVDGWACVGAAFEPDGLRVASASARVGALRASVSELHAAGASAPSLAPLQAALDRTGERLTPSLNAALDVALPSLVLPMLNGALDARVRGWDERCATGKVTPSSAPEPGERAPPKSQARLTAIVASALAAALGLAALGYGVWWRRWRARTRGAREAAAKVRADALEPHGAPRMEPTPVFWRTAGAARSAAGAAAVDHRSIELGMADGGATKGAAMAAASWRDAATPASARPSWAQWRATAVARARRAYRAGAWALAGSLASESGAPRAWALTLLSCAVLCTFAWSNSTVQAELVLVVRSPLRLANEPITLYELSLGTLLRDLTKRGPTLAALAVALLSGVWPQAKLLGVLACWLAPPTVLPPSHRERALVFLHANGKWSLVEFALLAVAAVVFNLSLELPAAWFGDELSALLTVSTFARPRGGLFAQLVANLASIAISHAALARHSSQRDRARAAERARAWSAEGEVAVLAEGVPGDAARPAQPPAALLALGAHAAASAATATVAAGGRAASAAMGPPPPPPPRRQRDDAALDIEHATDAAAAPADPNAARLDADAARLALGSRAVSPARPTSALLAARVAAAHLRREPLYRSAVVSTRVERAKLALALAGLPCSVALVLAGSVLSAFRIEVTGLAGLLAVGGANVRTLSLVQLGAALPAALAPATAAARGALAALFFALHLALPLALPFAVALLWAAPLALRAQRVGVLAAHFASAISGVEILMLALIASLSELEALGQLVLRGRCDALNEQLEARAPLDALRGDPRCFSVSAEFERGYWVLLTAAVVSFFALRLALRRCELALERRAQRAFDDAAAAPAATSASDHGEPGPLADGSDAHEPARGEMAGVPVPVERRHKPHRWRSLRPRRAETPLEHAPPHDGKDDDGGDDDDDDDETIPAAAPRLDKSRHAQPPHFVSYRNGSWVSDYPLAAGDELPLGVLAAPKRRPVR